MKAFSFLRVGGLAMAAMILFSACSKEGDQGPKGDTGAAGPTGPTGPAGASGVADVYYSDWIDVALDAYDTNEDEVADLFASQIDAGRITQDIIDKGEIKVYINIGTDTDPEITALPFLNQVIASFVPGKINITAFANFSTYTEEGGAKGNQYRYIIIPGTAKVSLANRKIDLNNYSQVAAALKLKN